MTVQEDTGNGGLPRQAGSGTTGLGLLVLRLFVGLGMAAYGAQKLFGLFGGTGIEGNAEFFDNVGFSPGTPFAILSGLAEFGGGLLIVIGLALPLAAAAVVANMVGAYAVRQAAAPGDFFFSTGGPELELFYIVAAFSLILTGPGSLAVRIAALDSTRMRVLGVVLAVAGGVVVIVIFNL